MMASFRVSGLALFVYLLGLCSGSSDVGHGKLVFSHILFRHGDRTPTSFYPTDPYDNPAEWPVSKGKLTNTGKTQHYELGQWLRDRYDEDFLPKRYNKNSIYVRANDVDRIIVSAQSNLAGLYPPNGDDVWNDNIHWQPIPVHTVPDDDDFLLADDVPACSAFEKALDKVVDSKDVQTVFTKYKSQINYLLENAGQSTKKKTLKTLDYVRKIRNTFYVETLNKKTLPAWTHSVYPSEWIDEVSTLHYSLPTYTPKLTKFRAGFLLKDILERSTSKANGTLSPENSVYVYATHDLNLATLLQSLGIVKSPFVEYAATLLFELRVLDNVPYLEIFYKRNSQTKTAEVLFVPDCGYTCPLATFYELYDDILPTKDFNKECKNK